MKAKFNFISTNFYNSTVYLVLVLDLQYKIQIFFNNTNADKVKQMLLKKYVSY